MFNGEFVGLNVESSGLSLAFLGEASGLNSSNIDISFDFGTGGKAGDLYIVCATWDHLFGTARSLTAITLDQGGTGISTTGIGFAVGQPADHNAIIAYAVDTGGVLIGSKTVRCAFSGTMSGAAIRIYRLSGFVSSSPVDSSTSNGTGTSTSHSMTATAGCVGVFVVTKQNGNTITATGAAVVDGATDVYMNVTAISGASTAELVAGSVSVGASWTGSVEYRAASALWR